MKLSLLLLALQVPTAHGFLCFIFGLFAGGSAGSIELFLDTFVAGQPEDATFPPYDKFQIDDFATPVFNGCEFTFTADFQFFSSITGPDGDTTSPGTATMVGTFDVFQFLFSFFQVCIDGLTVTELDFENSPGKVMEDFAEAYINSQFDDPECFEEEE